ncbi:ABC transporter permease [Paenibacillus vini]|uniref:ABC transporter permease n=1 Tax=Paenibacillus vini TaxID=1476024 RepID=UPI0025B6FCF2|nr:ABC transporter permease [Paenibacillus vini]MDN4066511.1 ABC transporter permease [Paenibacillus vini]
MVNRIKEIFTFKEMLKNLTTYDLRTRYKGSFFGFLWSFLNPLLLLSVYYLVFSSVMRIDIDYYFLYMFIGLLPWTMFQSSILIGVNSIISNANLIKKIYFPREVIPLSVLFSGVINYFFGLVIVIPFLFLLDLNILRILIWFPFVVITQSLFTLGLVFLLSSLNVLFRDVAHMISIFITAWFYFTPVVYPKTMISPDLEYIFNLNPMKLYIDIYHDIFYYNSTPNVTIAISCVVVGVITLIIGWMTFNKLQIRFAEEV